MAARTVSHPVQGLRTYRATVFHDGRAAEENEDVLSLEPDPTTSLAWQGMKALVQQSLS